MSAFARVRRSVRLRRPRRWLVIGLGAVAFVVGGAAAAAYAYDRATDDRILPGVRIAGIDVSGMTHAQALKAIEHRAKWSMNRKLTIHAGDQEWTQSLASLGMHVQPERAVDQAFRVSSSVSWMSRVYHRLSDKSVDRLIPLSFSYNKDTIAGFVNSVVGPSVTIKPQNAALKLSGESLVVQHSRVGNEVKPLVSARLIFSAVKDRRAEVELPILDVQPEVTEDSMGQTITVDVSTNTLRLWEGLEVVRTYPVATATYGFTTPIGEWNVVRKMENPTWYNPCLGQPGCWAANEPPSIPPGPGNPLGTRAVYLDAPGIRIHGTPSDSSIGTYASHGCIRMHISDSEALYPLVEVGARAIIYGAPPWGNQYFDSVAGT